MAEQPGDSFDDGVRAGCLAERRRLSKFINACVAADTPADEVRGYVCFVLFCLVLSCLVWLPVSPFRWLSV